MGRGDWRHTQGSRPCEDVVRGGSEAATSQRMPGDAGVTGAGGEEKQVVLRALEGGSPQCQLGFRLPAPDVCEIYNSCVSSRPLSSPLLLQLWKGAQDFNQIILFLFNLEQPDISTVLSLTMDKHSVSVYLVILIFVSAIFFAI